MAIHDVLFVKGDSVMVLATGVTATTSVLAVLADTTSTKGHLPLFPHQSRTQGQTNKFTRRWLHFAWKNGGETQGGEQRERGG